MVKKLAVLAGALMLFHGMAAALMFEKKAGDLTIAINPNVELMYTLLQQADTSDKLRREEPVPDVRKLFAKYKEHPAVKELDSDGALSWNKGFEYDAFASFPLYFSDMPEGKRIYDYKDEFLERILPGMDKAAKIKYLDAYWEKVRDFYNTAHFADYLAQNAGVYQAYVDTVTAHLPPFDPIKLHEDYHANKDYRFFLLPSPLSLPTGGNYGLHFGNDIYDMMGSGFSDEDTVAYMTLHEFGHSFCNPVVEKNAAGLSAYAFLMEGLSDLMERQAYYDWQTVMYELLVRSVHARLVLKTQGAQAAEKFLSRQEKNGFVFIRDFYDKLDVYEHNRDKYPTLFEFYPELVKVFDNWELRMVGEVSPPGLWPIKLPEGIGIQAIDMSRFGYKAGLRLEDSITAIDGAKPQVNAFDVMKPGKTYLLEVKHKDGSGETIRFTPPFARVKRPVRKTDPVSPDSQKIAQQTQNPDAK